MKDTIVKYTFGENRDITGGFNEMNQQKSKDNTFFFFFSFIGA